MLQFPATFLWGAATSAYATEGGNFHSDWWRWEQRPGRIRDGSSALHASRHAERFESDFELAAKLGHRAHLFTVEWSRAEPEPGRFDTAALDHYASVADALHRRGLEPICALHHVSNPQWFTDGGGWHRPEAPDRFAAYARRVFDVLGPACRWWLPLLEPAWSVSGGYIDGSFPPAVRNPWRARRALRHMAMAHHAAAEALHARRPDALAGASLRLRAFWPADPDSPWDLRAARRMDYHCNEAFLDALRQTRDKARNRDRARETRAMGNETLFDFVGVSFYGVELVEFSPVEPLRLFCRCKPRGALAGMSPGIGETRLHPFETALHQAAAWGAPLLVTGNGLPTNNDSERSRFLLDHIAALGRCLQDGLDIRGYLYYSLLDGFEWTEGLGARYGLIHVDHEHGARTPNPSAYLYKDVCETGTLRPGTIDHFCPGWRAESAGI